MIKIILQLKRAFGFYNLNDTLNIATCVVTCTEPLQVGANDENMENTRDCNICIIRDCPDRPRLGKPVIFNCPNFKGKEDRIMTQEEWEAHSDDWRQGWIDYVQGNDEDMTKKEKAQKSDEWKAGARYACLHPTFPVAVPM